MRQYGFSTVEVAVACAIAALLLLAAIPAALGTRPGAAASAALTVDAVVARAQAIASTSGNGATLQFTATPSGTSMRLYSGRPISTDAIAQAAPDTQTPASISEASLGAPPFAVFFDSSGHAGAMAGTIDPATAIDTAPGCPVGGNVTLVIHDARVQQRRTLSCAK